MTQPAASLYKVKPRTAQNMFGGVTVREAAFEDYGHIRDLIVRYGLQAMEYEQWRDLWLGNPAYTAVRTGWPIGWVLETEGQRIVGYLGNIPIWYRYDGQTLLAAVTHAWVVEASYRTYSLLLLDSYFGQQGVDLYLSTTVNAQASNAFTSFNSSRVPVGAWDRAVFWIAHYRGFAASWAAMKRLPRIPSLSYFLSLALWCKDYFSGSGLISDISGDDIECSNNFDDRFDVFWEALIRQNPQVLLAVRTQEVLKWHFKNALSSGNAWLLTLEKQGELAAYSVFIRQDSPTYGLTRVRLVDFQALNGNTPALLPMLIWALKKCREQRIHMLECVGAYGMMADLMESLTPHQRSLPCWPYYYKAKSELLARSLENPKAWSPTCFDGDSSL